MVNFRKKIRIVLWTGIVVIGFLMMIGAFGSVKQMRDAVTDNPNVIQQRIDETGNDN
jgi:uncharacterized protein YneF (UPF0154 family)